MTKGILLLFIAFSTASVALAAPQGAEARVRGILAQSGIKCGVDATNGRYVFVGTCEREIADPVASKTFMRTRSESAAVAELTAKRDILVAFKPSFSGEDSDVVRADATGSRRITTSVFKTLASENLEGASVLCSAESWDAATGLYQIAVAVAWSKKLLSEAVNAVPPGAPRPDAEEQAEWDAWVEKQDFSATLGGRQFKDSRGVRRFVGIGCVDVEGKIGAAYNAARIVAETEARASLALALYGDSEMKNEAVQQMSMTENDGVVSTEAWEKFASSIRLRCKAKQIKGNVVHRTEVVHPITGRRMLVVVFGMRPEDQAEMNALNNQNK